MTTPPDVETILNRATELERAYECLQSTESYHQALQHFPATDLRMSSQIHERTGHSSRQRCVRADRGPTSCFALFLSNVVRSKLYTVQVYPSAATAVQFWEAHPYRGDASIVGGVPAS